MKKVELTKPYIQVNAGTKDNPDYKTTGDVVELTNEAAEKMIKAGYGKEVKETKSNAKEGQS
ncbi:hypothetical protein HP548_02945 [Paenibacillus taichungensis]|uniref:Uncharacterized protein n=1 Tax=Paenibacillus taichungensis TaxID=484184 RepID=A0ABX2MH35_9BACL|nr:hypothetical protein [Paenibacillus taichungensis]NUU53054.1 hypothetical protein [Paenibacillus taichungensis]